MAEQDAQSFPCKEPGCDGTVTYRREVVKAYRGVPGEAETQPRGRIIRVYLECLRKHEHEYAVRV